MKNKHPLVEYAAKNRSSLTKIAKDAGLSRMTLYRIMGGDENTTVDTLRKISAATNGKVSVAELISERMAEGAQ